MIGGCGSKKGQCPTLVEESGLIQLTSTSSTGHSLAASQRVRFGNIPPNRPRAFPTDEWRLMESTSKRAQQRRRYGLIESEPSAAVLLDSLEPVAFDLGNVQNVLDRNMNYGPRFTAIGPLSAQSDYAGELIASTKLQTNVPRKLNIRGFLAQVFSSNPSPAKKPSAHVSSNSTKVAKQISTSYEESSSITQDQPIRSTTYKLALEGALEGLGKLFETSNNESNIEQFKKLLDARDWEKLYKNANASSNESSDNKSKGFFMRSFTTALAVGNFYSRWGKPTGNEIGAELKKLDEFYQANKNPSKEDEDKTRLVKFGDVKTYSQDFISELTNEDIKKIMIRIREGIELFRPFSQAADIKGTLPEKGEIDAIWLRMGIKPPLTLEEKKWLTKTPS